MNILAVDNSTALFSSALSYEGNIYQVSAFSPDTAVYFVDALSGLLKQARADWQDIDCFALGIGPGSFTGLRIGLSIVKAFSCSLDRPVVDISSFLALAYEYAVSEDNLAVIFNAGKGLIYGGVYCWQGKNIRILVKPGLFALDDFIKHCVSKEAVFAGESFLYKEVIKKMYPGSRIFPNVTYPQAKYLLKAADLKIRQKKHKRSLGRIVPLYLHADTCQIRAVSKDQQSPGRPDFCPERKNNKK